MGFPFRGVAEAIFDLSLLSLFNYGVKEILKTQHAYLFYLHPWEVDCEQPKVKQASFQNSFRHYCNLSKTAAKLNTLIKIF